MDCSVSKINTIDVSSYQASDVYEKVFFRLMADLPSGTLVVTTPSGESVRVGTSIARFVDINVSHSGFFKKVLMGGSIGFGEAYIENMWTTSNLTACLQLFARNMDWLDSVEKRFSWLTKPAYLFKHWRQRNKLGQSKKNILAHYDLGNALYERFLDGKMVYSSGIYDELHTSLEQAQDLKMKTILDDLELSPNDHLLEIGTGWGALALMAAERYGCKVTTTTLSDEQFNEAKARFDQSPAKDRITLLKSDYRELEGQFDKIVSVEMIEAVGREFMPSYFSTLEQRLKPGGKIAIQSITIADQRYDTYASGVDFIQAHIFPGGFLPCIQTLASSIKEHTSMRMVGLRDFGLSYATTLQHWRDKLLDNKQELNELGYDERFFRLWLFYLAYCEAGFLEETISVVQFSAVKPK